MLNALAGVFALPIASPASSQADIQLFSADNFLVAGDLRVAAPNGERSWVDGGFGKLRFGANDAHDHDLKAALGSADLVWQPKLGWAVSATVVSSIQQQDGLKAGLSEAFVSVKPIGNGRIKFSGRAGLMWPPVSLEHGGPEWAVRDTITPSAINSWIGEEVKIVGAEGTLATALGGGKLSMSAAVFDADDTAGALIAFRGWALHDLKALAGREFTIPKMDEEMEPYQPYYTHPIKEMDGFLNRPGYYVRAAWEFRAPVRLEAIHYDNGSDPESVDVFNEWGWRTRFDNIGATALLGRKTELRMQAMRGHSKMGFVEEGARLVETSFRSAFALVTYRLADADSISARAEVFDTHNHGSEVTDSDDELGWATTIAGRLRLTKRLAALIELLHVESRRDARERIGLASQQAQTQLQGAMRFRW